LIRNVYPIPLTMPQADCQHGMHPDPIQVVVKDRIL
jgi:hypothetical protein